MHQTSRSRVQVIQGIKDCLHAPFTYQEESSQQDVATLYPPLKECRHTLIEVISENAATINMPDNFLRHSWHKRAAPNGL